MATENLTWDSENQRKFLCTPADWAIFGGARGGGKRLGLDTPIPIPGGWATIGQLSVGDFVFTEKGIPCRVLALHPVTESPESYQLTFDDGTTIDACADHLWLTFDKKERVAAICRNYEWRKRRRSSRASRVTGNKSAAFTASLTARNKTVLRPSCKDAPAGTVRTTRQIAKTLYHGKEINHAIPVAGALQLPERLLPLDPYLLGVWLGDGHSSAGYITTADRDIVKAFISAGFPVEKLAGKYVWKVVGLKEILMRIGLIGNKHVPSEYLRASPEQRLALLQGLFDTDGTGSKSGAVEFDNTNRLLIAAAYELIVSLGGKATIREGRAKLYGKDCGPRWRIKCKLPFPVFRLARKLSRQKRVGLSAVRRFRYIVKCERIAPAPMRCLTVDNPTGLFLVSRAMIPTHNSFYLLLDALRGIHDPQYRGIIVRQKYTQIAGAGGLWDESMNVYPHAGGRPKVGGLSWDFPSGARIEFRHLEHDKDVIDFHGSQAAFIGVDEAQAHSEFQINYLAASNRSVCTVNPYCRFTCNPDPDSWLATFLAWWIDQETGYPIPERAGVLRYFFRDNDGYHWGDTKEELFKHIPQKAKDLSNPADLVKSATFIPSSVYDNKHLLEANPNYLASLLSMPTVQRERFLYGNWKIRDAKGAYNPNWFLPAVSDGDIPKNMRCVRAWDLAATVPKKPGDDPDWTCGLLLGKDESRMPTMYYILDIVRKQGTPYQIIDLIKTTAGSDGPGVHIYCEEEGAAGGKFATAILRSELDGRVFKAVRSNDPKNVRSEPFFSNAEGGLVKMREATKWNSVWLNEVSLFGTDLGHDDCIDAASLAHIALASPLKRGVVVAMSIREPEIPEANAKPVIVENEIERRAIDLL